MKPKERKEKLIIMTLFHIQPCQPLPHYIADPPTLWSQSGHQPPSYPVDNLHRVWAHPAERYTCQKQGRWAATLANIHSLDWSTLTPATPILWKTLKQEDSIISLVCLHLNSKGKQQKKEAHCSKGWATKVTKHHRIEFYTHTHTLIYSSGYGSATHNKSGQEQPTTF